MYYYLYKITNITNNKCYFGSHKTENLEDGYLGSGIAIKRAINKYGINSFKKDILSFHNSEDELRKAEDDFLKSLTTKTGLYNLKFCSMGGNTRAKYTLSKKKKYIQKLIDHPNCPIGKKGSQNHMFGKKQSSDFKQARSKNMKEYHALIKNTNQNIYNKICHPKKIQATLENNEIIVFNSIAECAKHFNINKRYLSKRIKNINKPRVKSHPFNILPNTKFEYIN